MIEKSGRLFSGHVRRLGVVVQQGHIGQQEQPFGQVQLVSTLAELGHHGVGHPAGVSEQARGGQSVGPGQGPAQGLDAQLPAAALTLVEQRQGGREVALAGGGKAAVLADGGRFSELAQLHHHFLGPGQVGVRLAKPPCVHVSQPAVTEGPSLAGAVAEAVEARDDRPVRLARLVVTTQHAEGHGPLGGHQNGRLSGRPCTVERRHGLVRGAGQHEHAGQTEARFGHQVDV